MSKAFEIVKTLAPLSRHFASPDYDEAIRFLQRELPFEVYVYGERDEHNGWVIPPRYEVKRALIKKDGIQIYNGLDHPLGVPCHASSFQGFVSIETLREHLWFDHRFEDAIPYHFRFSYRPWERTWGFCVPKTFYDTLADGEYEIDLEVSDGVKELKVLEYTLPGSSGIEFAFIAHLDHPGMANDDLAGCAVGVELFQELRKKKLRHTYRLLIVQEIIGSEMHLFANSHHLKLKEGLFLEMLGADVPLVLQRASNSPSAMEMALEDSIARRGLPFSVVDFRESAKNDEIVFEAFGIPTCSLIRYPYCEYHSSRDNISIISRSSLDESLKILVSVVEWHEDDFYLEKMFKGVSCFSNPNFDLYIDPGQPAFESHVHSESMHKLMEEICLIAGKLSIKLLCSKNHLPFEVGLKYLRKCEEKGLFRIT
jgi:aminopeptidase-like protein